MDARGGGKAEVCGRELVSEEGREALAGAGEAVLQLRLGAVEDAAGGG